MDLKSVDANVVESKADFLPSTSRRAFLAAALSVPLLGALAACGSSGPSRSGGGGGGAPGAASYWFLSSQPQESIRTAAVERFNQANPDQQIQYTAFQNDAYKTKIKTAVGAGQAPTIIFGWGGGTLRSYVDAGQVDDLTSWFDENPAVKDRLFPTAFGPATIDGRIYAMPAEVVQPVVLYYNKEVFDKVGAAPPQSWGDIMDLVPKFNATGVAPISLAGQSRWPEMMWLEFLFDRLGGPEVFEAAYEGEHNAWSHPAAIDALTKVQELIKADGFVRGFSSVTPDSNADQALLYTGKAAMMLQGSWTYGGMATDGGDFVSSGKLGYMNFPPVDGGTGDPSTTVGNPAQYLSIYSKATDEQKEVAKKFLSTAVLSDQEIKEWIDIGSVPIVQGTQGQLAGSDDADFLEFIYRVSTEAKTFGQSWDQALSPTAAETLLDNIAKLFQLSISPQQFADNMNQATSR
ncbi:extracellular solute-binding protein [Mycolicibacterium smegmatis]|uniref:Extracellular solute-binding protein, family protein 1 n=2 Tax=Mycolicibacterium smegmatis TaxID=1772 RepID=A0R2K3_MYCS2|nr:extracellular solute-binding protein [Mycolicibacterium smegmatis]ABK69829.1 extracellular solute-binding protein, family protein 1 [Mycolicibacterium smegmatis MC2 155]MCC3340115.1 extracellular solute-binding protein [Mycolicibacterium smegmatis]MCO4193015.1 extracellular solute-binding protein [Mycolicibacterium smegmatis]TBH28481.1 extracellular solute-binding protein [Mycolicibacterium smegmatis MC2 155]TBM38658.1 extracellular solute-binding protein [Mycolicibacterium smegmatis]